MIKQAKRHQAKIRIGLTGTSGSGKTYSGLLLASGMAPWEKICLIDTENGSGELYSDLGPYNVITLTAPFTPEKYVESIAEAQKAGMEVIIIDSATHEWDGAGGCLEIVETLTKGSASKNSYTTWAKVTPRHQSFIQSILQSPTHMIITARRKQDYDMEKGADGKTKVTKIGLKEVQREGIEYEWTINLQLDQSHLATASKDRTGLFMGKPEFVITPETGREIMRWNASGEAMKPEEAAKAIEKRTEEAVQQSPKYWMGELTKALIESGAADEADGVKRLNETIGTQFTNYLGLSEQQCEKALIRFRAALSVKKPIKEVIHETVSENGVPSIPADATGFDAGMQTFYGDK